MHGNCQGFHQCTLFESDVIRQFKYSVFFSDKVRDERALTLAGEDGEITEEHLSEKISGASEKRISIPGKDMTLQQVIERIERQMVSEALQETGGNRSRAARILGLTRQGLLNKIGRYGIKL